MSKVGMKNVSRRPPYTGPSQVVTTDHDEMQTTLQVYAHVGSPNTAGLMQVHDAMGGEIDGLVYLRKDRYPHLHAVLMLLKDDKYADPYYKGVVLHNRLAGATSYKLPAVRYYCIPMKLGEIAAVEPELAEMIRVKLKEKLFNNLRGQHAKLFQD